MLHIKKKIATTLVTGTLLCSAFAGTAFAQTTVTIQGNGSHTDSRIVVEQKSSTNVSQNNTAHITNDVSSSSQTGGNRANDNTHGDVSIWTGNAHTSTDIENQANANFASVHPSGMSGNNWFRIGGNGSRSQNEISFRSNQSTGVNQHNYANFENYVEEHAQSGGNSANENTRGDIRIRTGNASTSTEIQNNANVNVASVGNGGDSSHDSGNHHEDGNHEQAHEIHTMLTGKQEVPGPGDPDGYGHTMLSVKPNGEVCVEMHVNNISHPIAAHIHEGMPGVAGPAIVPLPTPNDSGMATGCMTMDSNKAMDMIYHPSHYYVNVHTTEYPDGAIRGQL